MKIAEPATKLVAPAATTSATTTALAPVKAKPKRAAAAAGEKIDPRYLKAARELRDRWMEKVNENPAVLEGTRGKYEVSRQIAQTPTRSSEMPLLEAA